jgi:hypothetical protein
LTVIEEYVIKHFLTILASFLDNHRHQTGKGIITLFQ